MRLVDEYERIDGACMEQFVRPTCTGGGDCPPTCEMHVSWLRTCIKSLLEKCSSVNVLTGLIDSQLATTKVRVYEDFLTVVLDFCTTGRLPQDAHEFFISKSKALFEQRRVVQDGSTRYAVCEGDTELNAFFNALLDIAKCCAKTYGLDLHWHHLIRAMQFEFNKLPVRFEGLGMAAQRRVMKECYSAAVAANLNKPYPEDNFCSQQRWDKTVDELDLSLSEPIFRMVEALNYETEWEFHIQ